jgi:hypothetical protein
MLSSTLGVGVPVFHRQTNLRIGHIDKKTVLKQLNGPLIQTNPIILGRNFK